MFEKEAEEYVKEWIVEEDVNDLMQDSFQDGAEFGYNKAKEEDKWHYVKDELPPENIPLIVCTLDKDKKRRYWESEYKGGNGTYWQGYFNHYIDKPYAWKEITPPKEIKEK